ncbi:bifunctional UDP-sugar hydrolase/5'-nucleotidase periplasmic precursor [Salmonella enterica subsp. arizonae]|uniref:Bifunctional UDP-sugar hydrolase/5'-nucleotidase periplasmic n=1 Tax=Salmonella enterica subsp. arizonae TaxID=59203 RepID=A0A2X4TH51_SALER|nr:bifunctional UDP-sugar hydrolase/5'-nucleotidase periplasmic precursor [Salmonella enterica subsp. arizonae]SUG21077.1 bifunctional UDP-sugar hydrolase/5'-nucleotidase periplasmic precursor [Salmonella enterica subsp. arizonae]VDY43474.1 bifunctional UDP-sugar hydrolase/5'-nucleotidase periplasmic precursor [Salmonella enterica subsp. arizonae]
MKFLKRGVALALLAAFALVSQSVQAYEKDKTYKITILHTNDHHGHFWRSEYGEYGLAAQKTLVDSIRKEVAQEGEASCCYPAATLILVCRSPISRMRSPISAG